MIGKGRLVTDDGRRTSLALIPLGAMPGLAGEQIKVRMSNIVIHIEDLTKF